MLVLQYGSKNVQESCIRRPVFELYSISTHWLHISYSISAFRFYAFNIRFSYISATFCFQEMFELLEQKESPQELDVNTAKGILYGHALLKGVQTGAFLGVVCGSLVYLKNRKVSSLLSNVNKFSNGGQVVFGSIVPAMVYFRMKEKENMEWQDRAWRLAYNKNQNVVDNASVAGGILGFAAVGSVGVGVAAGVATAAVYNTLT